MKLIAFRDTVDLHVEHVAYLYHSMRPRTHYCHLRVQNVALQDETLKTSVVRDKSERAKNDLLAARIRYSWRERE